MLRNLELSKSKAVVTSIAIYWPLAMYHWKQKPTQNCLSATFVDARLDAAHVRCSPFLRYGCGYTNE